MSQKIFNEKEVNLLKKNPYVKKVSEKAITYQDEFKQLFVLQLDKGKTPRMIFEQVRFDVEILGMKRIKVAAFRWKQGKRVIITRIEKRRPHLYTGITDEISFLLDSFTMFLNIFCPW